MRLIRSLKASRKECGQIVLVFAFTLPLLLFFVGFGIDYGFAFLTKSELAKASDAAALAVMRNLGRGTAEATTIGTSIFYLNYNAHSGPNALPPTVSFDTSQKDSYGDPIVTVTASATTNTFFIRIPPVNIKTITEGVSSQATRPPVILAMVLDRTGSMTSDGGSSALPPAVRDFLGYFIEGTDRLGEVSFAFTPTNDVPITQDFQAPINNYLNAVPWGGGTYSMGGLQDGYNQILSVTNPPPNAVKVMVFFTDGWDNTIQAVLPPPQNGQPTNGVLVEFGGCGATTSGFDECGDTSFIDPGNGNTISYMPTGGSTVATCYNTNERYSNPALSACNGATAFTPTDTTDLGTSATITRIHITTEAEYSTVQLANQMRAQGITVYSIGLGSDINQTYLEEIADDPGSPEYDNSQYAGRAEFAPNAADLDQAFQTIASKILLRLTQ